MNPFLVQPQILEVQAISCLGESDLCILRARSVLISGDSLGKELGPHHTASREPRAEGRRREQPGVGGMLAVASRSTWPQVLLWKPQAS